MEHGVKLGTGDTMNETARIVRIAIIAIGAALLIYFGLGVIRSGAPRVGSAAGTLQNSIK